ncbi:NDxxF motif lipoprotein [Priestia megaterium]|uniref:NDxxF motif lipoprotein n=1 Tax=Priestia megaterium TaxID=1404 RepID=UPI000D517D52|nr:NDxxF motif lipoprotein [Priestia megaterium]PVE74950.1 NDxxF motif lipoprotein [Priestia megaterium]PVE84788.1 NDxxF motif lipoprotein [Priestia megaterium]PVE88216.1 NDxxF motif lipoprotein [Priestia megaterium]PVE95161.1 NDxxF motif lipoprotein [Priestia megaterium]
MKKLYFSLMIIFLLGACSYQESTKEVSEEIVLPTSIFSSSKNNAVIDEKEMKESIKTYLNTNEDLSNISDQFEEMMDSDQQLTKAEAKKLEQLNDLVKENDRNFSTYISHNTLPEGDKKESERISRFIMGSNQILDELDQAIDDMVEHMSEGDFSETEIESLMNKNEGVNGREQKKIENFLDDKNIDTKAFGRKS